VEREMLERNRDLNYFELKQLLEQNIGKADVEFRLAASKYSIT
jgi:hypothetical protein